jgi:MurNAc alpha-1-phosphate uridylyltransferase
MPDKIKKAMVLAAGYGMRLRPLTDRIPKPLIPVAGKPMIEYALDRLREYGVEEVVINVSHLKEQLIAHLSSCKGLNIKISEEAEPLETGGGLKHALPLLGSEPFFTINSDILWFDAGEPALERLARNWDDNRMDLLLLVQPRSRAPGYEKGEDYLFVKPHNTLEWTESEAPYIFASVGIMHPRILANAPDGKFSVKLLWQHAMSQGRLFCLPHHGLWFQTGTHRDIQTAEAAIAKAGLNFEYSNNSARLSSRADCEDAAYREGKNL